MRINICMQRASLLIAPVVLCIAVLACGTSSPPVQSSPVTNAVPAESQTTPEPSPSTVTPTDTPAAEPEFETTLAGDDLAKFQSLPDEFRDALQQEYQETNAATTLSYLRGLPDEAVPISEVLEPVALGWFGVLQPDDQRFLLLEGYPEVYRREAQDGGDLGGFLFVYQHMVEIVFDNRGVKLPPPERSTLGGRLGQARLDGAAPVARVQGSLGRSEAANGRLGRYRQAAGGQSVRSADGETVPTGTRPLRRKHRPVP